MLDLLAAEMGVELGTGDLTALREEMTAIGPWDGQLPAPQVAAAEPARPGEGQAVLATWHHLLDAGSMQDGEPFLAGTAPRAVARMSATTAQLAGVAPGGAVTVSTDRGSITLPAELTQMPDHVVWVPTNSVGSTVRATLGADAGELVRVRAGAFPAEVAPGQATAGVA
jgi:NADH-quinone oxidoreductase subunit G